MSFRTHDSQKIRNNLPDYWLWRRCSDLSAGKAIVAWDAEERILWGSSWSLPAAPSEIPPPSCSHSATEKNSRNSSSSSYYPIILLHIYIIFIENRKLYLRRSLNVRKNVRKKEGRKEETHQADFTFVTCHDRLRSSMATRCHVSGTDASLLRAMSLHIHTLYVRT